MIFKVTCQYSHQDHTESTDLGLMSPADLLRCFDEFDWEHEIAEANRLGKVSPTLSVEDVANRRLIWVSGYDDTASPAFVSECTFPGMKKRLFGLLGEGVGVVELHAQEFDAQQARRALELFVSNNDAGLRQLYYTR